MQSPFLHKANQFVGKLSYYQLVIISILAISFCLLVEFTESRETHPLSNRMIEAATKMKNAEQILYAYKHKNNIEIDSQTDPLHSGFIGVEFSPITTTLGDLNAKQTSTNPDFAALYVRWFNDLKLENGDKIVLHSSGSFPALTIAAIIACEVYELDPIVMSSVGASSFGANIPILTYWDTENILLKNGVISHKTEYATYGGQDDNGSSFWDGGMDIVHESAKRNSININRPKTLAEAIEQKMDFINSQKQVKLLVNIGGNQSALGEAPCSMAIPHGVIREPLNLNTACAGIIHKISTMNIPVVHMLNIKDIALENGIDLLPDLNHKIGNADIYFITEKSKLLATFSLGLILFLMVVFLIKNKKIS